MRREALKGLHEFRVRKKVAIDYDLWLYEMQVVSVADSLSQQFCELSLFIGESRQSWV
jgi:hypothetical protein